MPWSVFVLVVVAYMPVLRRRRLDSIESEEDATVM
jgi:hypothetical protein